MHFPPLDPNYLLDQTHFRQTFNRVAAQNDTSDPLAHWVGNSLLERLEFLNFSPSQILDLGIGTGRIARGLSAHYPTAQIYAMYQDLTTFRKLSNLRAYQDLTTGRKLSNLRPYQDLTTFRKLSNLRAYQDAMQLPLADNSIDLLCSNLLLCWCNDQSQVLTEMRRVLKPDGKLLFTTLGPDTLKELRHSWAAVDSAIHVHHFWDLHQIGDWLLQLGFKTPVMDVDRVVQPYAEVPTLLRALQHSGATNLTVGRRRQLTGKQKFQAMIAKYESYRTAAGQIPATFEVVYGYASGKRID